MNLLRHIGFPDSSADKEFTCNAGELSSVSGLGRSHGEGIGYPLQYSWSSLCLRWLRICPQMWETWVRSLGWEDPLEVSVATHSNNLAWRIPTPVFLPGEFWENRQKTTVWSGGHQSLGFRQGIISRIISRIIDTWCWEYSVFLGWIACSFYYHLPFWCVHILFLVSAYYWKLYMHRVLYSKILRASFSALKGAIVFH